MLEILLVWFFASKLQVAAMNKGLSRNFGALAFLWFAGEILAGLIGAILRVGDLVYPLALAGAVLGAVAGWAVLAALPPAPGWQPGMRWAGYCKKCKANVWIDANGRDPSGHSLSYMKQLYVPGGQQPSGQVFAPPRVG